MNSGTGVLPVGIGGIGILPMIHGLEAHATLTAGTAVVLMGGTPMLRSVDLRP